jgi:hypothetical protein
MSENDLSTETLGAERAIRMNYFLAISTDFQEVTCNEKKVYMQAHNLETYS